MTWPPFPVPSASAARVALCATVTSAAAGAATDGPPFARAMVVPTAITPPPAWPDASSLAPGATVTDFVAVTSIEPPVVPGCVPRAASWPWIVTDPPIPAITMLPVRAPPAVARPGAAMLPPASTRLVTRPSTAAAVSRTVPPWAAMVPVLVTSAMPPPGACVTCFVTSSEISPSP